MNCNVNQVTVMLPFIMMIFSRLSLWEDNSSSDEDRQGQHEASYREMLICPVLYFK